MSARVVAVCLALLLAACVVGDPDPDATALEAPTFDPDPGSTAQQAEPSQPEPSAAGATADGPDAPDGGPRDAPPDTTAEDPDAGSGPADADETPSRDEAESDDDVDASAPVLRSRVTDARGDTESTRLTAGPDHADLVGGVLERHADAFRLEVEVDGGVPEQARDGDHTMNVASFYDITGNGHVDVEVWANLADGGWDTAWFDNRTGEAAYSDEDEITVAVDDARLVLRFPLAVLDAAERLRWAVASEWGRYEQLGTPLSVRDEMPDDGRPAPFPG